MACRRASGCDVPEDDADAPPPCDVMASKTGAGAAAGADGCLRLEALGAGGASGPAGAGAPAQQPRWSPRRLLTKHLDGHRWLGRRPTQRWCELDHGALVYYSSSGGKQPRGRIPLHGCHLSVLQAATGLISGVQPPTFLVRLLRPGKSSCELHLLSQCDIHEVVASIYGHVPAASSRTPSNCSAASSSALPSLPDCCVLPLQPPATSPTSVVLSIRPPAPGVALSDTEDDGAVVPDELWPPDGRFPVPSLRGRSPSSHTNMLAVGANGIPSQCSSNVINLDDLANSLTPSTRADVRASDDDWSMPAVGNETPEEAATGELLSPPADGGIPDSGAGEVYQRAMIAIWNFDLTGAAALLEPFRRTQPWHAAAFAECAFMRVLVTARHEDAALALELVCEAEGVLDAACRKRSTRSISYQVITAELLLFRCFLQGLLGARIRALYNLRQCWQAYRRLEHVVAASSGFSGSSSSSSSAAAGGGDDTPSKRQHRYRRSKSADTHSVDDGVESLNGVVDADDLRGRICFGVGFFWLATSLLPSGLGPLLRLAGFVMDRERGKDCLAECAEGGLGTRAVPAAISLAMFHLDLEPDVARAGNLLVAALTRTPENPFLHWSGSMLAWRNCCLDQAAELTGKAMWCCGEELGGRALFLRYEMGMLSLARMRWDEAYPHLRFVYEAVKSGEVFFVYRLLVPMQLASACFHLGREHEGVTLCTECVHSQDFGASSNIEGDFSKLLDLSLKHRSADRKMLAFEVIYLLRQFPRLPVATMVSVVEYIRAFSQPFAASEQIMRQEGLPQPQRDAQMERFVEFVSARTIECVLLFYLADLDQAMTFVPQLAHNCTLLPPWCAYLAAHGLYWSGRVMALSGQETEAARSLRHAKALKNYPFNISKKISSVLAEFEAGGQAPAL
mmetsp:Transcript_156147/g.500874  ORF Transcript_156147/g.500874 Transcript_156147/m.500874 type:complete len:907 (+) Transcript_156147:89-2809(+)